MQKQDYAAECAISGRPFTVFRWRPGNDARYGNIVVRREIALAKTVCRRVSWTSTTAFPQARDAALGRANEMQAKLTSTSSTRRSRSPKVGDGEDAAAYRVGLPGKPPGDPRKVGAKTLQQEQDRDMHLLAA